MGGLPRVAVEPVIVVRDCKTFGSVALSVVAESVACHAVACLRATGLSMWCFRVVMTMGATRLLQLDGLAAHVVIVGIGHRMIPIDLTEPCTTCCLGSISAMSGPPF